MSSWDRQLPLSLVRILDNDGLPAPPQSNSVRVLELGCRATDGSLGYASSNGMFE